MNSLTFSGLRTGYSAGRLFIVALIATVSLGLYSCDGIGGGGDLDNWTDSISYAIGVDIGSVVKTQGVEFRPEVFKRGFEDGRNSADPQQATGLSDMHDTTSYAYGYQIGRGAITDSVEINLDVLIKAYEDVTAGKALLLDSTQSRKVMEMFTEKLNAQREGRMLANKAAADEFLQKNRTAEGVQVTSSGLQYKVLTEGSGPSPDSTDNVKVIYKGTLLDGTEFDSSKDSAVSFSPQMVVPGFGEALRMMKKGSKWRIWIPPDLGYGPQQLGEIKPNSLLVFDVEVVDFEKGSPMPQMPSFDGGAHGGGSGQ